MSDVYLFQFPGQGNAPLLSRAARFFKLTKLVDGYIKEFYRRRQCDIYFLHPGLTREQVSTSKEHQRYFHHTMKGWYSASLDISHSTVYQKKATNMKHYSQ